jgi:hypothetical protein
VLLVAGLSASSLAGDLSASLPHPGPTRRAVEGGPARQNRRCETCHREIAREWRASSHHLSFTNAAFQRSVGRENKPAFCIDCHAPETTQSGAPRQAEAELGVACVTCHMPHDSLLGAPGAKHDQAPHQLETRADFASAEACRGCHEFRFADARPAFASEPAQWMQRTWREHHDGNVDGSSTGCGDCHMPKVTDASGGSHHRHDFPGGYATELVRGALRIEARRSGATAIEIKLTPNDVTHAVPTGDLFRRLELSAQAMPSGAKTVRYLTRHHQRVGRGQRVEVADDRPRRGTSVVVLELGNGAVNASIRYRVAYQRVDHLVGDDEARAVVAGEIELASGEL